MQQIRFFSLVERAIRYGACGLVFCTGPTAHAQGTPAPAGTPAQGSLPAVEVRTKRGESDRELSVTTKITITRDDLSRFGDANIVDALQRAPGVTTVSTPGGGVQIRLRGLGEGYTRILLDGEPVPPGTSIESLAPALVERIEIERVPTAESGTQAIAGVINIITRRPSAKSERELRLSSATAGNRGGASLNGNVSHKREGLTISSALALSSLPVTGIEAWEDRASSLQSGGTRVWRGVARSKERLTDLALSPHALIDASPRDILSFDGLLRLRRLTETDTEDIHAFTGDPPIYAKSRLRLAVSAVNINSKLGWTRKLPRDAKFELNVSRNHFRRQPVSDLLSFTQQDLLALERHSDAATDLDTVALRSRYRAPLTEAHSIVLGVDRQSTRSTETRTQVEALLPFTPPENISDRFRASVKSTAIFAQDEIDVSSRLSVYLGLRWESIHTSTVGTGLEAAVSNRSNAISPIVQAAWKIPGTKRDQLRLAMAHTYKPPTPSQLSMRRYLETNNSPTSPDRQGNASLVPETAWGIDASYERFLAGGGHLIATAYMRRISNVILPVTTSSGGRWLVTPVNLGDARTHGIELEARGRGLSIHPLFEAFEFRGNLARNWSSVKAVPAPNNRIAQQPTLAVSAGTDWKGKSKGVSITAGLSVSYVAGGPIARSAEYHEHLPARKVVDTYVSWPLASSATARLSVSNLLRGNEWRTGQYADATTADVRSTVRNTERTVRLAVEMKF